MLARSLRVIIGRPFNMFVFKAKGQVGVPWTDAEAQSSDL